MYGIDDDDDDIIETWKISNKRLSSAACANTAFLQFQIASFSLSLAFYSVH
jgi:hypothetical protein